MIQNEITFNNVKTEGFPRGSWPVILNNQQGPDEDGGIINAVDIDWNEALLNLPILNSNIVEITTTGLLLKIIQDLAAKIPSIEELDQRYKFVPTLVMPANLILNSPSGEVDVTTEVRGDDSPVTYTWAIKLEDLPYAKLKYYDSGTESEIEGPIIEGGITDVTIVATNEARPSITPSDSGIGGILDIATNNYLTEGNRSYFVYCNAETITKPYIKTQLRIVEVSLVTDPSYPSSTGIYKFYVTIPGDNRNLTDSSQTSNFSWSVSTSENYTLQESSLASGRPLAPNLLYISPLNNTFLEQEATIECTVTWENGYSLTFSKDITIGPRHAYRVDINDSIYGVVENFIIEGTPSTTIDNDTYFASRATISVTGYLDYDWPYYNLVSDLVASIDYDKTHGYWYFVMPYQNVNLNLVLSTLYEISFNDATNAASISVDPDDGLYFAPEGLDITVTTTGLVEIYSGNSGDSHEINVTNLGNNLYQFEMPAENVTINITPGTD